MKITCETAALKHACDTAKRAVSGKTTIPVLEGLLLRCERDHGDDGGVLIVTGYDLEVSIQTRIDAVARRPGEWVIDAALLCGILGKIADDKVTIEVDQRGKATISGGAAEFKLSAMSTKEYPELPSPGDAWRFDTQVETLKSMIKGTVFAAAVNKEAKPIHTGVLFEFAESTLTCAAIDGFRLATRNAASGYAGEPVRFVVPPKVLKEIMGLKVAGDAAVHLSRRHIAFDIGGVRFTSRLLDGEFMNYRAAIPQDFETEFEVRTRDLLAAIERVSLIINEKIRNPIVMALYPQDGSMIISCKTSTGEAQERVSVQGCTMNEAIGFNHGYLADALSACDDDMVTMRIKSAVAPVIIAPPEGDAYMHMVLPVRLNKENGREG